MRRMCLTVCAALTMPLAACQGADRADNPSSPARTVTLQGNASYLEKVMPTPGSMLRVQVVDTRHPDAALAVLAEDSFNASSVPIPFRLEIEGKKIEPNVQYGVRASLRDVDDKVRFKTDTAVPVDLKSPAPLELRMVPTSGEKIE
ncbi:YbaY family lipoprotein [Nannocystis punicea]|uniref:YbaY family lipoprotein n=1 Tax=Nannocystis punicea TaxID=2995304 RepID=A0ABY7H4U8_9BACT|nr:YbaY family lipoprotein [Nannocystis poenicansa]WAS94207.1 YbaY family lipoprotein [Nannocystis poenicansa]